MTLSMERGRYGNAPFRLLNSSNDDERNLLALNVLLLGDRQSGRSSVGDALIGQCLTGAEVFQSGACMYGVSVTTECRRRTRSFPRYSEDRGRSLTSP
ncbi:hypothetical protein GBF38_004925 [Nibea albiflora]|uniref:Uncharacterized protein n=1 Tax=Nibea albiflora TaxID=240163 RepID=A0ACB7EV22_NIBAL|nr:hypothetical protein GBF38_004925 [Nibea albiflora]